MEKCALCTLESQACCERGSKLFVEMDAAWKRYKAYSNPMYVPKHSILEKYNKFQEKRKAFYAHLGIEV